MAKRFPNLGVVSIAASVAVVGLTLAPVMVRVTALVSDPLTNRDGLGFWFLAWSLLLVFDALAVLITIAAVSVFRR